MPESYVAEPTPGTCTLCPDPERARVPHRPPVCNACRSWLAGMIGDIRILAEQLEQPEDVVRDERAGLVRLLLWRDGRGWVQFGREQPSDPIANAAPAGPTAGLNPDPRVSGTHGAPVPANLTRADMTAPARPGSLRPYIRGVLGEDEEQVGHLSLATVLAVWVQKWRAARDLGETGPALTVEALSRWLADRADWACDKFGEVRGFADEMRHYRSALRQVLGLSDRSERKPGVPCPKCDSQALYRRLGSDWIECGDCDALLSQREYEDWLHQLAAAS